MASKHGPVYATSFPSPTLAGNGFSLLASATMAMLAFAVSFSGARLSQLSRLTALVVALEDAIVCYLAVQLNASRCVLNA